MSSEGTGPRLALATLTALVGGSLLMASGVSGGLGLYGFLLSLLEEVLAPPYDAVVSCVMTFLTFLASLGGLTVFLGGLLIYMGRLTTGKFLIRLGSGTGVLGYFAMLASRAIGGVEEFKLFLYSAASSLGWIGITFSVACLVLAKKPKAPKLRREEAPVRRVLRP